MILDVDTIRSYEAHQPERTTAWKKVFKTQYGVPYHDVVQKLDTMPEKIIPTMDRRASARVMRHWQKQEDLSRTVLQCAKTRGKAPSKSQQSSPASKN